jgi:hypothetical protein
MIIPIEHEKSFDCPEGSFSAVLVEVKSVQGSQQVRFVFEIEDLSTEFKTMLAGKNYKPQLSGESELRRDLESWLGENFLERYSKNGHFDPALLQGLRAGITIAHKHNSRYSKPFVFIQKIHPAEIPYSDKKANI